MTMRIIPENHHFKPSFHPSKRKASAGKAGKASPEKEKFQDRLEISHQGDNMNQPPKIVDDQYQRFAVAEGQNGAHRAADSSKIEQNDATDNILLEGIGLTDERISEIRQQISDGMYESVVVQKTVADMITRDLLK